MLRPNYAMDPPPTALTVGGSSYPIDTDYRTWLRVLGAIRSLNYHPKTLQDMAKLSEGLKDIQEMVFGGVLKDESAADALDAISEFLRGYPSPPVGSLPQQEGPTVSFDWDLNEIIIAIQDQHGVDCSWRRKESLHWWEFKLLYDTLSGDHYILQLRDIRGYTGNDRNMKRRKAAFALPVELSGEEQAEWDEFEAQFEPKAEDQA